MDLLKATGLYFSQAVIWVKEHPVLTRKDFMGKRQVGHPHGQRLGHGQHNGHYRDTVYHPLLASYAVAGKYDSMQEGHRLGNGFWRSAISIGSRS